MFKRLILLSISALLAASIAFAEEEVRITDCNGAPRLSESIRSGGTGVVFVDLSKETSSRDLRSVSFSLVSENGEGISGSLTGTRVRFNGVGSGSWRFCLEDNDRLVQAVSFHPDVDDSKPFYTTALAAAAGVGGILAITLSGDGGSSGGDTGVGVSDVPGISGGSSPTGSGNGGGSNALSGSNSHGGGGITTSSVEASSGGCFIGDDVTPLSPFS